MSIDRITSPDSPALAALCAQLAAKADEADQSGAWPAEQLRMCGEAGVYEWFLPVEYGGQDWSDLDLVRGYLALAAADLTTTFIITQRTGACRRVAAGENDELKSRVLPMLTTGENFATVGISHLTTSHRHLKKPVLTATRSNRGIVLNGFSPWVTGGDHAQCILTGAVVIDGDEPTTEQVLAFVPTTDAGVRADAPAKLVGLSHSHTGRVFFDDVTVTDEWLVAGPVENVMMAGRASRPGGHETSTLALGLANAALNYMKQESLQREELRESQEALATEHASVVENLLAIAQGQEPCTNEWLRQQANSLVLRTTQAALAAAKGAGYLAGHPVGRWCREALFFLVWSCPQPVMNANLCELAGLWDDGEMTL
ncbi:acyl-CoA/acyl-ACP dehydrogenase [Aeoliella sp. ICT_H6.2]|uniref:Acyl-CoA/acyl-ACP dehydrogenase n=1 Tax=Aeoliella straminimaris TaxID=2954799 RepID=A0A9X2FIL2_9BACT|nr:acyl-CoA dehydrogenase family protein [Aeoliella straminimaris]MCO6046141.1 acyl-CoA/acyl-ACP dehydrogenase [Aeoliella straminimaris]